MATKASPKYKWLGYLWWFCLKIHPLTFYASGWQPRTLFEEMLKQMPSDVTMEGDLVPGDDIRCKGNAWLRSSFNHSGLRKVPRENQIRILVAALAHKKKLGSWARHLTSSFSFWFWYVHTWITPDFLGNHPWLTAMYPRKAPHWTCPWRVGSYTGHL